MCVFFSCLSPEIFLNEQMVWRVSLCTEMWDYKYYEAETMPTDINDQWQNLSHTITFKMLIKNIKTVLTLVQCDREMKNSTTKIYLVQLYFHH